MSSERLATLEEKVEQQARDITELKKMQMELLQKMARYEGKWGGILMVIGSLYAFWKVYLSFKGAP